NLVRLRYGEPIYFLDINSMLSQRTLQAQGNLSWWKNDLHGALGPALRTVYGVDGNASRQTTVGGNLQYSDHPGISYAPVQGEKFSQQFMTPIPAATLAFLSQSGWNIDRILECCVQRLNDLSNVPIQDAESNSAETTRQFRRVAGLLKILQNAGRSHLLVETRPEGPSLILDIPARNDATDAARRELGTLLGLSPEDADLRIRIIPATAARGPQDMAVQSRSLLATMYGLAQQIPVP